MRATMQTAATHSSSSVFLRGESLLQRHGPHHAVSRTPEPREGERGGLAGHVAQSAGAAGRRGAMQRPRTAARVPPPPTSSPLAPCCFCCRRRWRVRAPMIVTQKKELRLLTPKYCESISQTRRRPTRTVDVRGPCCLGLL